MSSFILSLIVGCIIGFLIGIRTARNEIKQSQKAGDGSTQIQIASINNEEVKE